MITINGKTIESPKEMSVDISDLDSDTTTRNAKGQLLRDRIAVKRKITLAWGVLTSEQISVILNSVAEPFCSVTYTDPMTGGTATKTFYVSDRSAPVCFQQGDKVFWKNLAFSLTEQ